MRIGSDHDIEEEYQESVGYYGMGDLTLTMLRRYKVENIVICLAFKDYDILKNFSSDCKVEICKRLKGFILDLYTYNK